MAPFKKQKDTIHKKFYPALQKYVVFYECDKSTEIVANVVECHDDSLEFRIHYIYIENEVEIEEEELVAMFREWRYFHVIPSASI